MRNPVFDVMKGIGILLVILGHMLEKNCQQARIHRTT